ncbi:hypothetical protein DUNSADRAFT_10700 [Dunaliella salina]|uniref:Encoded protein n=1 Tax=Dunaliella salina TaxID=3046 RepID=A0ABQ7GEP6_DUNSA|nr:hypothetical protein DUNSADRAFT_10700 [Dunaliella salina]|eukprot:KAF5833081.1 hypothetical protein DUNSADRAFT_10700 [Dunaliella salina]
MASPRKVAAQEKTGKKERLRQAKTISNRCKRHAMKNETNNYSLDRHSKVHYCKQPAVARKPFLLRPSCTHKCSGILRQCHSEQHYTRSQRKVIPQNMHSAVLTLRRHKCSVCWPNEDGRAAAQIGS